MGWMVLTVANMVQEKKTDGLGHDIRRESEGTKRGHKDDKEFAVDCGTGTVYPLRVISS